MEQNEDILTHWALRLGFDLKSFKRSKNTTVSGYRKGKFQLFRTNSNALIKLPDNFFFDDFKPDEIFSAITNNKVFEVKEVYHSYFLKDEMVGDFSDNEIEVIDESNIDALSKLRACCSDRDNQLGEVGDDDPLKIGLFENGNCVAAASLLFYGTVADIGVIVHPAVRSKGFGKKVVKALCRRGVEQGKIIHYGAILENTGSIKLAESLSFTLSCIIEEGLIR